MRRKILYGLISLLMLSLVSAHAASPVAHVAVVVGDASRVSAGGTVQALLVGTELQTGDRIRTGSDAVAILVFSDDGRLSLRADSELLIRRYEVDPIGVNTRIELDLIRGTVRQISGNGARAQPERYRLNTPIAAIGVRGTDFLAKTASDQVQAFVHEGKIVLFANNAGCEHTSTLGCDALATASTVAGSRFVRLESGGRIEQRDLRPGELEQVFGIEMAKSTRHESVVASRIKGLAKTGAASDIDKFELPQGTQYYSGDIFVVHRDDAVYRLPELPVNAEPAEVSKPPVVAQPDTATELITPKATVPMPTQLYWGRFSRAAALPDQFLLSYEEVIQGRHVTVGQLGQYALWRSDPSGAMDRSLKGEANFELAGAQALLDKSGVASPAQVTNASLSVNFDKSTFSAGVGLQHIETGAVDINVNGKVNDEGLFVGTNASERVAGALSLDGKEAGYLFSKDVKAGTLRGITLWTRK